MIPIISIFSRYSFYDRIQDGFSKAPNRRAWSFQQLYKNWIAIDFCKSIRDLGFVTVSYNNSTFINFIASAEYGNRHQILALSCFLDSCYSDSTAKITCPHEQGNEFSALFKRINNNEVHYTTDTGFIVRFRFSNSQTSQF
jgi:hypothetical protein